MKFLLAVVVLSFIVDMGCSYGQAQPVPDKWSLENGAAMPDFTLDNVTHYRKNHVTLSEFSGSWLVLDFWASFCVPCIASFPKMNKLQEQFESDVKIIMIGLIGRRAHTNLKTAKTMYEGLRRKQNLNLTVAYDSALGSKLDIWSVPRIIVIDPNGIVRIANTNHLDSLSLALLVKGDTVHSFEKRSFSETYEVDKLFDNTSPSHENNLLFASILSVHNGERPQLPPLELTRDSSMCTFKALAVPLKTLYRYAYIGKPSWQQVGDSLYGSVYPDPILEIKDTTKFSYSWDPRNSFGLYNFSLYIDQCTDIDTKKLMVILQGELSRYFGYTATIEKRLMPCWKLVLTSDHYKRKLRTRGGTLKYPTAPASGFSLTNAPVSALLSILWNYHAGKEPPFIDETGITGNIDIKVDALISDISDVKRALNSNGLDLVKGKRYMDVIVVRQE